MGRIHEDILGAIGSTPLVKLSHLAGKDATVLAKLESKNPGGSVKDRIALYMIKAAEKDGRLAPGGLIVEPTSGNTGIGLAMIAAARGYKLILTMPESMTIERRKLLALFGAEIVLTPANLGMKGAVDKANELVANTAGAFMPQQFKNEANVQAHRETTAREILADTDGKVDILVAAVGTGGTLTGCGGVLKEKNKKVKVIAVEPRDSHVLSGGTPGPHKIQGIGAGFVPDILDRDLIDEVIQVANEDAIQTARDLAKKEGILAGISAGANVWAALEVAKRPENKGKTIVTFICDTGERYISTEMYS
jgi:cysteine synthase